MEEEKQPSLKIWKSIIFIIVLSQIFQTIHIYRLKEDVKQFQREQVDFNVSVIQFHQEQLTVQKVNQEIFERLCQNDFDIYQIITLLKEDNVKGGGTVSNKEKSNSKELTKEEILYQQLKLLAEESKNSSSEDLPQLTSAMCEICKLLN